MLGVSFSSTLSVFANESAMFVEEKAFVMRVVFMSSLLLSLLLLQLERASNIGKADVWHCFTNIVSGSCSSTHTHTRTYFTSHFRAHKPSIHMNISKGLLVRACVHVN